jgi:hypothetical protein
MEPDRDRHRRSHGPTLATRGARRLSRQLKGAVAGAGTAPGGRLPVAFIPTQKVASRGHAVAEVPEGAPVHSRSGAGAVPFEGLHRLLDERVERHKVRHALILQVGKGAFFLRP